MGRLHRLAYHPYKIMVECFQVRLIPQLRREGFEYLGSVVLAPVEAAVHEPLHLPTQWVEEGGYREGGSDDGQGGLLAREDAQEGLRGSHAPHVYQGQHRREGG